MAECDRLGLAATLLPSQIAYSASPEALYEYLLESSCEGLVWLYPMSKDWAKIEYLSDAGFPVVVTRRSHLASGVASVESDELGAGLIAGNHMVDKGCKELLVFTYFNEADIDADEKMNYPLGFREGLRTVFDRRSDLDSDDIKFVYSKDMEGDNFELLKDALKRIPDDCGIIASGGSDSF
jgi:DNA-binding LacI/PurR family transcriptional regulator